ncbi:MAG: tRNA (guanosine(46)-N7)-methyltransferase TrmB [Oscillospiraceae bacterium]|nr:tRNA (guanosine(46)-N7)-methyltransferase TrmB [Oscillospiraceae bacterium]
MRKKPNLIPRMERCAAVQEKQPETLRGRWRGDSSYTALYLEIGCGKGRFTAGTAAELPDVLYVAVERVPDAMVVAMERVCAAGLSNVRFIDADARRLGELFAPGEADRIYINFCDPWPGRRHAKRRLTSPDFLFLYEQVLRPGGEVHLKTDNRPLFEYSLECFESRGWALSEVTGDLHADGPVGVMTDYEEKFYREGVPINRCVARRPDVPLPAPDVAADRRRKKENEKDNPDTERSLQTEKE